jgi:hypothetical protein
MNIMKIQVLRFLGFNCKASLVFHLCLGRPISVVPEVTTEKLASADDILPFVSCYLSISSDNILYLLIYCLLSTCDRRQRLFIGRCCYLTMVFCDSICASSYFRASVLYLLKLIVFFSEIKQPSRYATHSNFKIC